MTHMFPKISVIIPAYNVANYILQTLQSLQQQTLREFEALIIDDGSTDNTATIVQAFCHGDQRFQLLQKLNGGLSSARNWGMRHATTDYLALLDGDDAYEPDKLATHVSVLEANSTVGVVYSASRIIRDNGCSTAFQLSGRPIHPDPLLALLCKNFVGNGSNAVFRRCIVEQVGEFNEDLRSSEDVDYWLRIAALRCWSFYRVPQALSLYRVRPSGLSFNVLQMQRSNEQVLEDAYTRTPDIVGPMLPTARAYLYRLLARLSLTAGNVIEAKQFIRLSLESDASIFWRDLRSLLTLVSVTLSPLSQLFIQRSLGTARDLQA